MPPKKKKKLAFPVVSPRKGIQNAQDFARNLPAAPSWSHEPLKSPTATPGQISQLHTQPPKLCPHELAILHQRLTQPEEWEVFVPESPQQATSRAQSTTPRPCSPPLIKRTHSEKHIGDSDGDSSHPCDHYL